jgi:hypothetical protein
MTEASFEKCKTKFKVGDIYLDGAYHPTICLKIEIEERDIHLEGVSLFDGSWPHSCSVMHSAPDKISATEALAMKLEHERSTYPSLVQTHDELIYADGKMLMNGDKVKLGDDDGEVVCVIDRRISPSAFSEQVCRALTKRAVIKFHERGFSHYIGEIDPELHLIARSRP